MWKRPWGFPRRWCVPWCVGPIFADGLSMRIRIGWTLMPSQTVAFAARLRRLLHPFTPGFQLHQHHHSPSSDTIHTTNPVSSKLRFISQADCDFAIYVMHVKHEKEILFYGNAVRSRQSPPKRKNWMLSSGNRDLSAVKSSVHWLWCFKGNLWSRQCSTYREETFFIQQHIAKQMSEEDEIFKHFETIFAWEHLNKFLI